MKAVVLGGLPRSVWTLESCPFGAPQVYVAVLPCATRKQARAIVKWANLSREQKVEAIARILVDMGFNVNGTEIGSRVLNLIESK